MAGELLDHLDGPDLAGEFGRNGSLIAQAGANLEYGFMSADPRLS
jgi:hypothetical protein